MCLAKGSAPPAIRASVRSTRLIDRLITVLHRSSRVIAAHLAQVMNLAGYSVRSPARVEPASARLRCAGSSQGEHRERQSSDYAAGEQEFLQPEPRFQKGALPPDHGRHEQGETEAHGAHEARSRSRACCVLVGLLQCLPLVQGLVTARAPATGSLLLVLGRRPSPPDRDHDAMPSPARRGLGVGRYELRSRWQQGR
jgi:hypothetical protein